MQLFHKPPTALVLHHSAGPITQTVEDIKKFHIESNKWSDIGYHFVIQYPRYKQVVKDLIKPGRDLKYIGAHCLGFNSSSIGICVVGDWRVLDPHPLQIFALKAKIEELCIKFKIKPENILTHKEKFSTECPGDALADTLSMIKKLL